MVSGWARLCATAVLLGAVRPATAAECLRYAPFPVELVGTLARQFVDRPPPQDLFVNLRDVEVEGDRPDSGYGGPPPATPPKAAPDSPADGHTAAPSPAAPLPAPVANETSPVQTPAAGLAPPAVTLTPSEPYGPPLPAVPTAIIPPPVKRPPPPEEIWVVQLARPVCVIAERNDFVNVTERKVTKLQIIGETLTRKERLALARKRVVVRGQLLHALMPRHYTPVLVAAEAILLEQQAIAAMPGFGPRAPLE